MRAIICPTCRQDMREEQHPGLNGKDCPQCGQGISWRKAQTKEGAPKELFLVMTFGVASSMNRGIVLSAREAETIAREISKDGGAPKIYRCKLVK